MKKEFLTDDRIRPESGTWNNRRLEHLFGEALGDTPTPDETRDAWQTFVRRRTAKRRHICRITALGAAVAIIALVLVFRPLTKPEIQEVEVFTSLAVVPQEVTFHEEEGIMTVTTPPATITSILLSDGSKVWLGANSRLEYRKEFGDTLRSVRLAGEARFEVTKDTSRPFIVRTDQLQTRVLGTVFDVKAYPNYQQDVTLYEGRVNVSSTRQKQSREMQPGEQVSINKQGNLRLTKIDTEKEKNRASTHFSFDNANLTQVMREIGAWYNISVVFRSRSLLNERIYFRTDRRVPVHAVLDALNDLRIAHFSVEGGKIVVSAPATSSIPAGSQRG